MDLVNYPVNFSKVSKHPINPYPTHNAEVHADCFLNYAGQPATNFIGIKALNTPTDDSRQFLKAAAWKPEQHGIHVLHTPKVQKQYQ
jgi:hypothetical protein